jgi:hypothetical protein
VGHRRTHERTARTRTHKRAQTQKQQHTHNQQARCARRCRGMWRSREGKSGGGKPLLSHAHTASEAAVLEPLRRQAMGAVAGRPPCCLTRPSAHLARDAECTDGSVAWSSCRLGTRPAVQAAYTAHDTNDQRRTGNGEPPVQPPSAGASTAQPGHVGPQRTRSASRRHERMHTSNEREQRACTQRRDTNERRHISRCGTWRRCEGGSGGGKPLLTPIHTRRARRLCWSRCAGRWARRRESHRAG